MRAFSRLLATTSASPGRAVPLSLLPPIPLYRRVLRAQRKLPPELRVLGDQYIKAEFRAHRNVENPLHIVSFSKGDAELGVLTAITGRISHGMATVRTKD
jgi:hypothetical protein